MPKIKLANWYGDRAPGDIVEVGEDVLKALRRDGLVAETLEEGDAAFQPGSAKATNATDVPEPVLTEEQLRDDGEVPPQSRKRR